MTFTYTPLHHVPLEKGTGFCRPFFNYKVGITLDSPATEVMTDLSRVTAVTAGSDLGIEAANQRMIANGVRLLLVTDEDNHIEGIITANDILGEKPLQFIGKRGVTRAEILVRDIMTPLEKIEALEMAEVERARVGNIVETLKIAGRQHAVVVEYDEETRKPRVRGIFSSTQIWRQMGVEPEVSEMANTFAEVEAALLH